MPVDTLLLVPSIAQHIQSPFQKSRQTLRLNANSTRFENARECQQERVREELRESSSLKIIDNLVGTELRL